MSGGLLAAPPPAAVLGPVLLPFPLPSIPSLTASMIAGVPGRSPVSRQPQEKNLDAIKQNQPAKPASQQKKAEKSCQSRARGVFLLLPHLPELAAYYARLHGRAAFVANIFDNERRHQQLPPAEDGRWAVLAESGRGARGGRAAL